MKKIVSILLLLSLTLALASCRKNKDNNGDKSNIGSDDPDITEQIPGTPGGDGFETPIIPIE